MQTHFAAALFFVSGNGEWEMGNGRGRLCVTFVLITGDGGQVTDDGFKRCLPAALCCNRSLRSLAGCAGIYMCVGVSRHLISSLIPFLNL